MFVRRAGESARTKEAASSQLMATKRPFASYGWDMNSFICWLPKDRLDSIEFGDGQLSVPKDAAIPASARQRTAAQCLRGADYIDFTKKIAQSASCPALTTATRLGISFYPYGGRSLYLTMDRIGV